MLVDKVNDAIKTGKVRSAEVLVQNGLSIDEADNYGQTPIFYAVGDNKLEIIRKYATKGMILLIQKELIMWIN